MAADDQERKDRESELTLEAMTHPLRRTILRILLSKGGDYEDGVSSPGELEEQIGLPLSNISYHFRVLSECEMIRLFGKEQVRGSVKHMYRLTNLVNKRWVRDLLKALDGPDRVAVAKARNV